MNRIKFSKNKSKWRLKVGKVLICVDDRRPKKSADGTYLNALLDEQLAESSIDRECRPSIGCGCYENEWEEEYEKGG